jgi:shikimate 5-dehydrogenase
MWWVLAASGLGRRATEYLLSDNPPGQAQTAGNEVLAAATLVLSDHVRKPCEKSLLTAMKRTTVTVCNGCHMAVSCSLTTPQNVRSHMVNTNLVRDDKVIGC